MSKYSNITSGEVQAKLRRDGWRETKEQTSKRDFNKVCMTIERVPGQTMKRGWEPDVKIRLPKDENQRLTNSALKTIEEKANCSFG